MISVPDLAKQNASFGSFQRARCFSKAEFFFMSISFSKSLTYFGSSALSSIYQRVERSPLGRRMARGIFWSLAGAGISRVLLLTASIITARLLGKTLFGELGMLKSTIGMFSTFAAFGLGLTATKHVAELRQTDPERAGRVLGISGLVAIVSGGIVSLFVLFAAPWLAERTINAPHLTGALRISALILFFSALNGAQLGALSGFEVFRSIAQINLVVGMISLPILVAGAYGWGLMGAVWSLAITTFVNWLVTHIALRREAARFGIPLTWRNCTKEWSVVWKFSVPAALASMMIAPINWASGAILVNQPGGYAEMGVFGAANQWLLVIVFIPGMLWNVLLPLLSNLNDESKRGQYQKVLMANILLNAAVAGVLAIPLIIFARLVMKAYGPGYESGANVLRVLALVAFVTAITSVATQALVSKGIMWMKLLLDLLKAHWSFVAALWLIRNGHGALGLALATLISGIFAAISLAAYLRVILRSPATESANKQVS